MPAYSEPENAMACKLVTAYPNNIERNLPSVMGTVLLFEPTTGKVSAVSIYGIKLHNQFMKMLILYYN